MKTQKDGLQQYLEGLPGPLKTKVTRFVGNMTRIQRQAKRGGLNSSDEKYPVSGRLLIQELHEKYNVPFRALERPLGLRPMRGMNALRAYKSAAARKALSKAS